MEWFLQPAKMADKEGDHLSPPLNGVVPPAIESLPLNPVALSPPLNGVVPPAEWIEFRTGVSLSPPLNGVVPPADLR